MYYPDTKKVEPGSEDGGGLRYNDPLLVPTPMLLGRRERANKHPQATASFLQRAAEETLVYRHHSRLPCQLPGLPKSTFLMVFSPDGSKVASTHGDHNIYVSEVKTGECICTLEGHPRTPWCVAFHPSSNQIIASGCLGGEVRVWDLKGGSEFWTTERNHVIASLAFHPTDQVLVIATCNEIHFWDWSQPKPFAKISTSNEKEKVRYVKFDPLGHKLITGIANTLSERPSSSGLGSSVSSASTNSNIYPSRSQLVEREQQLSQRYNQLSSQYMNLMSRYEALTSRALNTVSRAASRIDRGTDPMEPLPPTPGQEARLQLARQYVRRVNDTERDRQFIPRPNNEKLKKVVKIREVGESSSRSGGSGGSAGGSGLSDNWNDSLTSDGFASSSSLGMEYDYGLSAVRTLRQIISDDSASESSSLDSSSSATSATSGVSERNARLSLLWSSRLHRLGQQDSDSAGEASGGVVVNQPPEGGAVGSNNTASQHSARRSTNIPATESNSIAVNSNTTHTNSNNNTENNTNNNSSPSLMGNLNSSSNLTRNERRASHNDSIAHVVRPICSLMPLEHGEVGSSRSRGSGGSMWGYFSSRGPIIRRSSIRNANSTDNRDSSNSTSPDANHENLNGGASGASVDTITGRTSARNSTSSPSRTSGRSTFGSLGSIGGVSRSPLERTFGRSVTGASERLSGRISGRVNAGSRGRYWSRVGRWLDRRNSRTSRSPIATSRIPEVENVREPQNPVDILGDSLDSALDAAHNALEDTREVAEAVASSSTGQNNNNIIDEEMTDIFLRRRIPTTNVGEDGEDPINTRVNQPDTPSNGETVTPTVSGAARTSDDHLAVPGPSGISNSNSSSSRNNRTNNSNNVGGAASRYQASTSSSLLSSSSSLDPQFGVQLLSRHIENMERICRAHLEISRHRHEILRLQQIRSMLYDIQHQIHSLRLSVDQSMEDQNGDDNDGSAAATSNAAGASSLNLQTGAEQQHTNTRLGLDESLNVGNERPPAAPCHWSRTSPRSVARLQRGPFGTRIRSRHSTRPSWVSPSLFRRLHGRRSRTRLQLSSPLRGSGNISNNTGSSGLGLGSSPSHDSSANPVLADETATSGTLGPPDQQLLRTSFRRLQERLVARQAELEMQERRLRGYLSNTNTPTTTAGSSVSTSNSTSAIGSRNNSSLTSTTLTSSTTTTTTSSSSSSSSSSNGNGTRNSTGINNVAPEALGLDADEGYITPPESQSPPELYRRAGPPTTSLASRIATMITHQSQFWTQHQTRQQEDERSPTSLLGSPTLGSPRGSSSIGPLRSSSPASALSRLSTRPRLPRHRWSASERSSWSDSGLSSNSSLRRVGDSLRCSSTFRGHNTAGRRDTNSRAPPGPPPTAPPPIHWEEDEDGLNSDFNNNSSQWYSARRRLRQEIINARRDMLVGRLPGGAGSRFHTLASLRARNAADRQTAREVVRRHRRDRYRQILQRMAERLNSLVNAEQHNQQSLSVSSPSTSTSADAPAEQSEQAANLRLLVRLALHLIYQLLNFICNQNISYEERPISRLPNPFREEELGSNDVDLPPPPPGLAELEPGLHNLTTLLETVRMASEELRNDNNDNNDDQAQSQRRAVTNVPRRLTDFLRRSGGLSAASAGRSTDRNNRTGGPQNPSDSNSTSPRPQLVIPRITLSEPNGSENQAEEENAAAAAAVAAAAAATAAASASSSAVAAAAAAVAGPSSLDPLELGRRSVAGVPLRLLRRQYAVDRRSPDSEESPGPPDLAEERGGGDPPFPWRGGSFYGPGGPEVFRPNLRPAHPDRAQEREDNYFSRPYFAPYFGASRTTVGGSLSFVVTQRIQAWEFSSYKIPDISDSKANIVVGKCRIHNDASVDISADGTMLAALVPESQSMTMVGVYSLEKRTLGQLLYSYIFANSTICVSLSPMARHLLVGFASHNPRPTHYHNQKQVVAQIYKLCDNGSQKSSGRGHQAGQLQFLRDIEVSCDHRHTSLNCIRWLPYAGQGLIYGTNRGHLNILR
ncbi:unnamed protein product, partial [Meganyctiphanes norvegica]